MKAKLLLSLFAFIFTLTASAEMRTWRDQKTAKAIVAELIAVKGDMIRLKMDNGREYTLSVSRFHEDDKAYVKSWKSDMKEAAEDGEASSVAPSKIRRALKITANEVKGDSQRDKSDNGKSTTTSYKYDFRLDVARDAKPMKNVVVNYTVYKRKRTSDTKDKSSGDYRLIRERGSEKFDALKPGVPREFKSSEIKTVDSRQEYKEKKKKHEKRVSEEIMGIHVEVIVNGQKAVELEEPSGLLRNVEKYN